MFRDSALKWHYYIVRLIRNVGKNTHICDKKKIDSKRDISECDMTLFHLVSWKNPQLKIL